MRYAFVENGKIVEGPRALPSSWRNISGFDKMSEGALLSLGWRPWIFVETPAGADEVIYGTDVSIEDDRVVETRLVRKKTPAEIEDERLSRIESQKRQRALAYKEEADPLFFKAQRGETPLSEWTAKVAEIRLRYPY